MADWASLINAPPPSRIPTICECEGHILTSHDLRGRSKVLEVNSHIPTIDTNIQDPKIGHKLQAADCTFLSAKQAFLEQAEKSSASAILNSKPNLFQYFEDWLSQNEEKWWFRLISSFNFGLFRTSLKINMEEICEIYSNTRDFNSAPVKCLAWHPHVAKIAVAMKDDSVQIATLDGNVRPILKHKKQKNITCMAWRPFSGKPT